MRLTVSTPTRRPVLLTDREFLARGGQAAVYRHGTVAYKIYDDPVQVIPADKVVELNRIQAPNVMAPLELAYDEDGRPGGFVMPFAPGAQPLCRAFTRAFTQRRGIDPRRAAGFVARMRETLLRVHQAGCLAVDLKEMNVLLDDGFTTPTFIDVDSYQTPRFPAGALMESIRDPLIRASGFTERSDWYAWGIICFSLYVGIHPFRGRHPDYPANAWRQRMDDHASVFDAGVQLPGVCEDFAVIPPPHLAWFKAVFRDGERMPPPDATAATAPPRPKTPLRARADIRTQVHLSFEEPIREVAAWRGAFLVLTERAVCRDRRRILDAPRGIGASMLATDQGPAAVRMDPVGGRFIVETALGRTEGPPERIFGRENRLYSILADRVFEHRFHLAGDRLLASKTLLTTCAGRPPRCFDGCLLQPSIDRWVLVAPYAAGRLYKQAIPELAPYRVVDARARGCMVMVIGETGGRYDRLVLLFDRAYRGYSLRVDHDVSQLDPRFEVLAGGLCVMATDGDEWEMFRDLRQVRRVAHPMLDADSRLVARDDELYVVDGTRLVRIRMAHPLPPLHHGSACTLRARGG